MAAFLYPVYVGLCLLLMLLCIAAGVWTLTRFHYRPTGHQLGWLFVLGGLVAAAFAASMLGIGGNPRAGALLAFIGTAFIPPVAFYGVVQYRGNLQEERLPILVLLLLAGMLALAGVALPGMIFEGAHYVQVKSLWVEARPVNIGTVAHLSYTLAVYTIIAAFNIRFLDLDAHFQPWQLIALVFCANFWQGLATPMALEIGAYPVPPLAAVIYPINCLLVFWVMVVKRPDVKLSYAVSLNPTAWHDLRNLVKALGDHTHALTETASLPPEAKDTARHIQNGVLALQTYMESVSRPRPIHASYLQKEDILIHALVADVAAFWRLSAEKKGLRFEASIPDEGVIMWVDPTGLRRSLDNLLNNAIKFTPAGGLVSLHTHSEESDYLITVRDTGIGIPKAQQGSIFQAYGRGSNVGDIQGEGLGLFTVQMFVAQHDGQLALESDEGQGTRITLRLPMD